MFFDRLRVSGQPLCCQLRRGLFVDNRMSGNQAHGTHHTGSGGYQNDTKMEENAHKWQIERDEDPAIKEAVSGI